MTVAQEPLDVYAEATPNPEALKFVVNQQLFTNQALDFRKPEETTNAPLAKALFEFEFVDGVFFMNNFISITKKADYQWVELIPKLRSFLHDYIQNGNELVSNELLQDQQATNDTASQNDGESDGPEAQIKQILEEHVKPAIEMDGGAIHFKSFEDGVVKVVLKGSCSGCPSSTVTLKNGIEGLLKQVVPGVESVEAEEG
jgi:Fe-S cluster biogenesis protein NfuA